MSTLLLAIGVAASLSGGAMDLPEVRLTGSPLRVEKSCRVVIEPGRVVDGGGDAGVIQIAADGITVEFADGSVLRGAPVERGLDELVGTGIVVEGHKDVTLRGVRVSGFKVGVRALNAPGLVIDGGTFEGMYAQRLKSTPAAEDSGDWLWPHKNDANEWRKTYGAAVSVKNATGVTIRGLKVRRSQNGILLDRVDDSKVYDNDCSFLSGWGLGMWRSNRNVVSRNALDFCIRGYSHGVYNRGQDSAGILMFEQCCKNVIVENSATHCGDGFFGFAGREALGETWAERRTGGSPPKDVVAFRKRMGCNDNVLEGNDFSFAAAHGIEMTFSFGNRFEGNRIEGNGICGVWGGYSAKTVIVGNTFKDNGPRGSTKVGEGGGVNIEHGRENRIVGNTFEGDSLGVRMWAVASPGLESGPWGLANGQKDADGTMRVPSARNEIAGNTIEGERVGIHLRSSAGTVVAGNTMRGVEKEVDAEGVTVVAADGWERPEAVKSEAIGEKHPVGAWRQVGGREAIVMGEWGPWDHASPMVRARGRSMEGDAYEVFGLGQVAPRVSVLEGKVTAGVAHRSASGNEVAVQVDAAGLGRGVWPYRVRIAGGVGGFEREVSGTIVLARWDVRVFAWEHDPLKDIGAWRAEAGGEKAVKCEVNSIEWPFGYSGPGCIGPVVKDAKIGANRFGAIARTKLPLRVGEWVVKTLSDDGVRVIVDGKTIIERWDIHGPTADRGVIKVETAREVEIVVEYFQNDGFATLSVGIEQGK